VKLSPSFHRRKIAELQRRLAEAALDGLLVFKPPNLYYLFGFFFIPTERTIAGWIPAQGEPALFVPRLEAEHASGVEGLARLEVYFEHLGPPLPADWIAERLRRWGASRARLGYEDGLPSGTLARLQKELPGASWSAEGGRAVADMRRVKEPEELALLRKAGEYADFMVAAAADAVRQGGLPSEIELAQAAHQAVLARMVAELDELVYAGGVSGGLVCAGPRAARPHGLPSAARPRPGDCLVLSFGCSVGGYHAESERTYFVGEPGPQFRAMQAAVLDAQAASLERLAPGQACAEVNAAGLQALRAAGCDDLIRHRIGHGMGLEPHEPPWLEEGDPSLLRPGMVVSVEPGLYLAGQGGCRVSDTVAVTTAGPQLLTSHPRDLAAMILEP
jgi:Xaa-Pro aminopeptidase